MSFTSFLCFRRSSLVTSENDSHTSGKGGTYITGLVARERRSLGPSGKKGKKRKEERKAKEEIRKEGKKEKKREKHLLFVYSLSKNIQKDP